MLQDSTMPTQRAGPVANPTTNRVTVSFATSCETCSSSAMLGRHPDGELDAILPFMIVTMQATVIYHLLADDQFFGFSTSLVETVQMVDQ